MTMPVKYQPPIQSRLGQVIDTVFVLALVYVALLLPLLMGGGASEYTVADARENPTWESLEQNPTMQAQWEKLDMTPKEAGQLINTRFDYSFEPWALIVTALVIIGYFVFVLRVSDREYRDVIDEKFGDR
jgi:hypothetical protein